MDQSTLKNRTFDEIEIGESASLVRIVGRDDIDLFATVSGDENPAHLDAAFAATDMFGHIVAHGMWTGALVSAVLGTKLPGPGTIYLGQDLRFRKPVMPGDTITVTVTVQEKRPEKRHVLLDTRATNQSGEEVLTGTATVIAPQRQIVWPRAKLPEVALRRDDRYQDFIRQARMLPALRAAMVHPCSPEAILAAIEIRDAGLLEPLLIGPEAKIRAAAEAAQASLDGIAIESVEHSHAAAARAVELAASGKVATLMKGSLHSDELLAAAVASGAGLRIERRVSHVYAMSVPAYAKPLIVTDAAINILPTLEDKRDIIQNAIDLGHAIGIDKPKVGILSAVEVVNPKIPSTLEAAALCKMADRGQITGGILDGPLAFDNAISAQAAKIKGISSPVSGDVDILLAPDLEAANMLFKQLTYLSGAEGAGIVLGTKIPVVLTSRADSVRTRLASVAVMVQVAHARRSGKFETR